MSYHEIICQLKHLYITLLSQNIIIIITIMEHLLTCSGSQMKGLWDILMS